MLTMDISQAGSMLLTTEVARCFFNEDTFYPEVEVKSIYLHVSRLDLLDQVIEGTRDGFYKECFHVLYFVNFLSPTKKHSQFYPYISEISTPKKRGIGKKLIFTIRAVMNGEHVDQVVGDFNRTAWLCSNRNNISTIEEAFCGLRFGKRRLVLHHSGDQVRFQDVEATCAVP